MRNGNGNGRPNGKGRMQKVDVLARLERLRGAWRPQVLGAINGQHLKLVRCEGPFAWHRHEDQDELFLVVSGVLRVETRDQVVEVEAGELLIVPRGVEHRTVAARGEAGILVLEPARARASELDEDERQGRETTA